MTKQQSIATNHFNHFIGIETLVRELDRIAANQVIERYPPHNIIKVDEYKYIVELATAGFSQDDLAVVVEDKVLKISGGAAPDEREYIQKGISTKSFLKTIPLIDTVEVRGATYTNGILRIELENVIPESQKPKNIPILGMEQKQQLLTE